MVGIGALIEQEIVRAGLAGDIDPAGLCLAKGTKLNGRGYMQNMDACPRPLRKDGCARHGLNGHDGRP